MHYDLVVVGGGVAGSAAVWKAFERNKKVLWFDLPQENYTTSVATGMINPIVLRFFTKSWKADQLLPFADQFYRSVNQKTGIKSYFEKPIYRILTSTDEAKTWNKKREKKNFKDYMAPVEKLKNEPHIDAPHGIGKVVNSGYVEVCDYMTSIQEFLSNQDNIELKLERFDHNQLHTTNYYSYQNNTFDNILFAEGPGIHHNPYFNQLPYGRKKGEVIEIETHEINDQSVAFKGKAFCISMGKNTFKIGSTFDHEDPNPTKTLAGKEELIDKLKTYFKGNFEVKKHYAGVRLTVKDRRPLLGYLNSDKKMYVLNGFGTKGVFLAPYFADQVIGNIFDDQVIDEEVDIRRFKP